MQTAVPLTINEAEVPTEPSASETVAAAAVAAAAAIVTVNPIVCFPSFFLLPFHVLLASVSHD